MPQLVGLTALACAFLGTPWLLACHLGRDRDLVVRISRACLLGTLVCVAAPVSLHAAGVPVTLTSLAATHAAVFAVLAAAAAVRRLPLRACASPGIEPILWLMAGLGLLFLPVTHLAGVDTYKWQCLAKSVRVEESVPWLVHPLSLLGFTPRAYPAAHPLLLATVQVLLPGAGVDASFYLVSLATAGAAAFCSFCLGRRLFGDGGRAMGFCLLYVLSPVFIRYAHWATGRGLFLAFLPLLLDVVIRRPRFRDAPEALAVTLLLLLCHRTALVAIPFAAAAAAAGAILPSRPRPATLAAAAVAAVAAACVVAPRLLLPGPAGKCAGFTALDASRFFVLTPLAAAGLARWAREPMGRDRWTVACLTLLAYPLAHDSDMYAAMVALPGMCVLAADGLHALRTRLPPARGRALLAAVAALVIVGALGTIARRCRDAAGPDVFRAAQWIEAHDPRGPFMVEAPGPARRQIQAYVSGCPRFRVTLADRSPVAITPPPPIRGPLPRTLRNWTAWLRTALAVEGADIAWYGNPTRTYYVRLGGEGDAPAAARLLWREGRVEIYRLDGVP